MGVVVIGGVVVVNGSHHEGGVPLDRPFWIMSLAEIRYSFASLALLRASSILSSSSE